MSHYGKKIFTRSRYIAGPSGRAAYGVVYGRSPAGIVGSNPTGGTDVCLLWVLCVCVCVCVFCQVESSLWRAGPSSREVLPTVVHRCV